MTTPWNPSYCIGDARIDQQHEQLFALANGMLATTTLEALQLSAIQLYKMVRQHFAEEEALMEQLHYPARKAHVEAHNSILKKLVGLSADVGKNKISVSLVEGFLNEWGLRHIPAEDASLVKFLKTHPSPSFQQDK
jgi:hemerythrin-like metal-binding protein